MMPTSIRFNRRVKDGQWLFHQKVLAFSKFEVCRVESGVCGTSEFKGRIEEKLPRRKLP